MHLETLPATHPLNPPVVKPKTPLDWAAMTLQSLCDQVDDGAEMTSSLVQAFDDAKLELAEAVDRRIAFDAWIKGRIETARQQRDEWDSRVQTMKAMHELFKDRTKAILEAQPTLPFAGNMGRIALQRNPPSLVFAWGGRELDTQTIEVFGVASEYVKTKVILSIDKDKVKDDLKTGKEITWAAMSQDNHIRFRK